MRFQLLLRRNMFPSFIMNNLVNRSAFYSKLFGQVENSLSFLMSGPKHSDNIFRNLSTPVVCGKGGISVPSLLHIFDMRSNGKVGYANTQFVVTCMQYLHSIWNFTMIQLPRYTVNHSKRFMLSNKYAGVTCIIGPRGLIDVARTKLWFVRRYRTHHNFFHKPFPQWHNLRLSKPQIAVPGADFLPCVGAIKRFTTKRTSSWTFARWIDSKLIRHTSFLINVVCSGWQATTYRLSRRIILPRQLWIHTIKPCGIASTNSTVRVTFIPNSSAVPVITHP